MNRRKSKRVSPEEPAFAKTISQVALFLDVGERVIYRWLSSGAPGKTEKGYDLQAIRSWRGRNLEPPRRTGPKAPLTGDAARLLKARADEKSAVARLRELELEIAGGKYVLAAKVEEHDLTLISLVTRGLDTWARSLPPSLAGLDERGMYAALVSETKALRTRLARTCSLSPDVTTPEADRRVLEAETALDFAMRFYECAFGEPPPRVACRGEPLTDGREIVEAALRKIRLLRGVQNGQG